MDILLANEGWIYNKMTMTLYILEGSWWNNREVPQVLPYFQALENSGNRINLSHRTFRNVEDIEYWVSKIPKNEKAFLYFACHGEDQKLIPADGRSPISNEKLLNSLRVAKKGAIEFVHFSCCEMISPDNRSKSLKGYLGASNAKWVSGYSERVDWLQSIFLDLALITNLAIPYHNERNGFSYKGRSFLNDYEQLVRSLGFSGGYNNGRGKVQLFPQRHRS